MGGEVLFVVDVLGVFKVIVIGGNGDVFVFIIVDVCGLGFLCVLKVEIMCDLSLVWVVEVWMLFGGVVKKGEMGFVCFYVWVLVLVDEMGLG